MNFLIETLLIVATAGLLYVAYYQQKQILSLNKAVRKLSRAMDDTEKEIYTFIVEHNESVLQAAKDEDKAWMNLLSDSIKQWIAKANRKILEIRKDVDNINRGNLIASGLVKEDDSNAQK